MNSIRLFRKFDFSKTIGPIGSSLTINPKSYHDPTIYEREKNKIFGNKWIPVGYTNQFEHNNIIPSSIHDTPIILTKHKSTVNGFYNVCRHRGCRLVDSQKKGTVMTCPYHSWTYSLDGDLRGTPLFNPPTEVFNKKHYSLFPVQTEIYKNMIFANLSKKTLPSVKEYYGDAFKILDDYPLEKCEIVKEKEYEIDANWKLLIDNFIEYYHLKSVHPKLVKNSGMNEHECTQGDGKYIGFKTDPLTSSGSPLDIEKASHFSALSSKNLKAAHFQMLYPTMFYFLFPNHLFSIIVEPKTPTTSIEKAVLMVQKGSDPKWVNDLWNFYDEVNKEDIKICEEVQKGLVCKPYKGGRMVPEFEKTIHKFHNMIISDLLY